MNVEKMSARGAKETVYEICDGMRVFIAADPEAAKDVLRQLVPMLDELSGDDFFGTEGWEHAFGIEG